MTTVAVSGWNTGFEKVKFTMLLQSAFGYPLSSAKQMTDTVLEGGTIELLVPDSGAEQILAAIDRLGAKFSAVASAGAGRS